MHPEPDELAALAADGREPDAAVTAHLRSCDDCRAEYEDFLAAAAQVRASATDLDLDRPPSSVWAGIHRELSLDERLASDPLANDETPRSVAPIRSVDVSASPRRGAWRWWAAVAAAVVIGVLAGVAIGIGIGIPPGSPTETVTAEARLEPLPGWTAQGRAVVETNSEGRRTIVVELDGDIAPGQLREVWLLNEDATELVSLGFLDGSAGRFTLPADIDLVEFPVVDVSSEPTDGNPAHSGDSIVRGQLSGV